MACAHQKIRKKYFFKNSLIIVYAVQTSINFLKNLARCAQMPNTVTKRFIYIKTRKRKTEANTAKCSSEVELQDGLCRFYLKCENVFCLKDFIRGMTKKILILEN